MTGEIVLLTGATGMIGFRILGMLLDQGFTVRAAVRTQAGFDEILSRKSAATDKSNLECISVPDITARGAYDEAVKGVKFIIHVASPLPGTTAGSDLESEIVRPAIQGTVGMLESAAKTTGIQRIVITASVASLQLAPATENYTDFFHAYGASKALSYRAGKTFMERGKPPFDVINIMPSFVLGRDDTVDGPQGIVKGTNGLLMGPLLGHPRPTPLSAATVHIDDVARLHVLALSPEVPGNRDFVADAGNGEPPEVGWADSFDIVMRKFPGACAAGTLKVGGGGGGGDASGPRPESRHERFDTSETRKVFGIEFKNFEEKVCSVVRHYLELLD